MRPKIIIVDDNEIIRILLKDLLLQQGYQLFTAENGKTALNLVEEHKPHLVLVDLMLPDISGIEVIKAIRKFSPTTESIIITGYSSYESAYKVLDSQAASGFLEKPIDINKLLVLINELLSRHEAFLKIQEDYEELVRVNTQLEFFNTIFYRDFILISEALHDSIHGFEKTAISDDQRENLDIIKMLYNNNQRLISSFKKIKKINGMSRDNFVRIDLVSLLNKITTTLSQENLKCAISFIDPYPKNKFFIVGTRIELEEMFFELFYSMIMPGIIDHTSFQIELPTSKQNEKEEMTDVIEIKFIIKTIKKERINTDILSEMKSQNYGLGFYIVKNYLDFFNGKIFLEDRRKNDELITTIIIFLPST